MASKKPETHEELQVRYAAQLDTLTATYRQREEQFQREIADLKAAVKTARLEGKVEAYEFALRCQQPPMQVGMATGVGQPSPWFRGGGY